MVAQSGGAKRKTAVHRTAVPQLLMDAWTL